MQIHGGGNGGVCCKFWQHGSCWTKNKKCFLINLLGEHTHIGGEYCTVGDCCPMQHGSKHKNFKLI